MALVAGIALVGFSEVGTGQEPVLLQLRGEAGSWLEYTHRKEIRVELPSDLGGPATTVTTIRLRQEVEGVSPEALHYASTLEEIRFDVSPEPDALPDLSGLQGLRFQHSTSRSGRTVALTLPGDYGEAGPGFMEQVENWLSQLGFPPLPEEAVQVGDTWSGSMPIPAAALGLALEYDLIQKRTARLMEIRTVGVNPVAILEVETTWIPATDPTTPLGGVASLRGTATQTVRFDLRRGRFVGSTGTSELELVLTPAGSDQYIAVTAAGRQVTGLTDWGGPGAAGAPADPLGNGDSS